MPDETDLSEERSWLYEGRAKRAVASLQKMGINAQYVPTCAEALSAILEIIPAGVRVVRGDSVTVDQVGIMPALKERKQNEVIDPFERDASGNPLVAEVEERRRMEKQAFSADIFITGTNAVTLDGKLVSTDALGNRVAPMLYGPEKVILVIGANKIVKDLDEALERIHEVCAPMNARRHAVKHHVKEFGELPCARTGRCVDCTHDWRICRLTVIIEGTFVWARGRINVVLVGADLGI
ncbi:lactate utilization protein [Chloroflexota bacterium]